MSYSSLFNCLEFDYGFEPQGLPAILYAQFGGNQYDGANLITVGSPTLKTFLHAYASSNLNPGSNQSYPFDSIESFLTNSSSFNYHNRGNNLTPNSLSLIYGNTVQGLRVTDSPFSEFFSCVFVSRLMFSSSAFRDFYWFFPTDTTTTMVFCPDLTNNTLIFNISGGTSTTTTPAVFDNNGLLNVYAFSFRKDVLNPGNFWFVSVKENNNVIVSDWLLDFGTNQIKPGLGYADFPKPFTNQSDFYNMEDGKILPSLFVDEQNKGVIPSYLDLTNKIWRKNVVPDKTLLARREEFIICPSAYAPGSGIVGSSCLTTTDPTIAPSPTTTSDLTANLTRLITVNYESNNITALSFDGTFSQAIESNSFFRGRTLIVPTETHIVFSRDDATRTEFLYAINTVDYKFAFSFRGNNQIEFAMSQYTNQNNGVTLTTPLVVSGICPLPFSMVDDQIYHLIVLNRFTDYNNIKIFLDGNEYLLTPTTFNTQVSTTFQSLLGGNINAANQNQQKVLIGGHNISNLIINATNAATTNNGFLGKILLMMPLLSPSRPKSFLYQNLQRLGFPYFNRAYCPSLSSALIDASVVNNLTSDLSYSSNFTTSVSLSTPGFSFSSATTSPSSGMTLPTTSASGLLIAPGKRINYSLPVTATTSDSRKWDRFQSPVEKAGRPNTWCFDLTFSNLVDGLSTLPNKLLFSKVGGVSFEFVYSTAPEAQGFFLTNAKDNAVFFPIDLNLYLNQTLKITLIIGRVESGIVPSATFASDFLCASFMQIFVNGISCPEGASHGTSSELPSAPSTVPGYRHNTIAGAISPLQTGINIGGYYSDLTGIKASHSFSINNLKGFHRHFTLREVQQYNGVAQSPLNPDVDFLTF